MSFQSTLLFSFTFVDAMSVHSWSKIVLIPPTMKVKGHGAGPSRIPCGYASLYNEIDCFNNVGQ